jgi:tetratricopeptide (TPR) repeat protein
LNTFRTGLAFTLIFYGLFSCSHGPSTGTESDSTELSKEVQPIVAIHTGDEAEKLKRYIDKLLKEGTEKEIEFLASDLFFKATDSSARGEGETSVFLFSELVRLKPGNLYLKRKYSIELVRQGKLEEAETHLSEIVKKQKYSDESTALLLGGVLTALDKQEQAQVTYKSTLKVHPSSEESCIFLAKTMGAKEHYKKAHGLLRKCEKTNKGKGIFSYYRAKLYLKAGNSKMAMRHFHRSLKLEKTFYQGAMAIGLMHEENKKIDKAISVYKKFLKNTPQSYPILSRLVQVMFTHEKYQEIIPYAEELSSLDQSDLNLKVKLGVLYSDSKKYEDAISTFKEILMVVPTSDKVLYYLASLYQETKSSELALETFSKIEETSSLYMDSSMQIAQILRLLVQTDQKKWEGDYLTFLTKQSQSDSELKLEMAVLKANYLEGVGEVGRAIASMDVIQGEAGYTDTHGYYLASLYEKNNDRDRARKIVEKMLEKNPSDAHALNFIGYSYLEEGKDLDKAYEYIKKAVDLNPADGYIRDSLAWYHYKKGEFKLALEEIHKAWSNVSEDMVINKHMAMIYTKLNEFELAKKFYTKALENCNVVAEQEKIQKALSDLSESRLPASQ